MKVLQSHNRPGRGSKFANLGLRFDFDQVPQGHWSRVPRDKPLDVVLYRTDLHDPEVMYALAPADMARPGKQAFLSRLVKLQQRTEGRVSLELDSRDLGALSRRLSILSTCGGTVQDPYFSATQTEARIAEDGSIEVLQFSSYVVFGREKKGLDTDGNPRVKTPKSEDKIANVQTQDTQGKLPLTAEAPQPASEPIVKTATSVDSRSTMSDEGAEVAAWLAQECRNAGVNKQVAILQVIRIFDREYLA